MYRIKNTIPAAVFCILLATACKSKKPEAKAAPKGPQQTIVDVIIAKPELSNNTIEANGTVVASEFLEIHPEISGRLTYLSIKEGSHVAQGTVLAKINDAELRAQMAKTRVQLDLAIKTEQRYKQLLDVSGINQSDYDAALNTVNGYKADIAYTQALINKTVIKAPFGGVIGLRQVSPGAYVTPGSVLATLQQVSQVKIDFTLPEIYGNSVKTGSVVDVQLDAEGGKMNKAVILATEPGANTDTRNLKVRAALKDITANPGAFVKVYITSTQDNYSIKVPTNCIIPDDRNSQVIVVKNGLANFVPVKTGTREAGTVNIESGLNDGDSVVVTGVLFARPKSPLKVRSVKQLAELSKQQEGE